MSVMCVIISCCIMISMLMCIVIVIVIISIVSIVSIVSIIVVYHYGYALFHRPTEPGP